MPSLDPELLRTIVTEESLPQPGAAEAGAVEELAFRSGNKYVGTLADGTTMDGAGEYQWAATGVTYKGAFKDNAATGSGTYKWPDGCSYEGDLVAGVRHGVGTLRGPGGFPCYEGEWRNGRRHGMGKLVYAKGGDVYEGQWVDDMREGQGTLTHANGNTYTGSWAADVKNGHGTFAWLDRREEYVGEWKDGKPHGEGEHVWLRVQLESSPFQLRERYVGEWAHGERHGHGTFHYASGARYVGEWKRNQKDGEGLFSFEEGSVYQGPFEADRMTTGTMRPGTDLFTYIDLTDLVAPDLLEPATAAVRRVLVRHNTDIKQVYRYYAALGVDAADAFVLDLAQFRAFAVDTRLASRDTPLATLDDLVMRTNVDASPTGALPSPYVLATTVAAQMTGVPVDMLPQLDAAAKYERRGVHDSTRKLLLREFVQGLLEIAALRLSLYPVVSPPEHPIHPLAQSLLDMMQQLILTATPTSLESAPLSGQMSAAARSRLELVYGHYAAAEPPPRCKKASGSEQTLTVRGYVRVLADAGLLPAGYSAYKLLQSTLPKHYLKLEPEVSQVDVSAVEAPPAEEGAAEIEAPSDEADGTPAEDAAAAPAEEEAAPAPAVEEDDLEDTEEMLDLSLIYSEFEECMLTFAMLSGGSERAPWDVAPVAPPESTAVDEEGAEDPKAEETNADEVEAPAVEEAPAEAAVPAESLPPAAALEQSMLPKMGAFLLGRLSSMASVAA